jgi:hypothetical protein
MKRLAALIALVSMVGCVYPAPYRDDTDDRARRPSRVILICIFACCRFETPTPSPSSGNGANALNPQASRLDPQRAGEGDRPLMEGEPHAEEVRGNSR